MGCPRIGRRPETTELIRTGARWSVTVCRPGKVVLAVGFIKFVSRPPPSESSDVPGMLRGEEMLLLERGMGARAATPGVYPPVKRTNESETCVPLLPRSSWPAASVSASSSLPSIATRTSPRRRPARSAGELAIGAATTTLLLLGSLARRSPTP